MSGRECVARPYRPEDRPHVRHICCETGFMGDPVDRMFCDREVFADFFTRYYTDYEPENCLVAEYEGRVVGYLLACFRSKRHPWIQTGIVAARLPRILRGLAGGRYDGASRRFVRWFVLHAFSETPAAPPHAAHFHFNVLPGAPRLLAGRRLFYAFEDHVRRCRVTRVYGQIQTYEDRRPVKLFERYGFRLFDRREVTKFRPFGYSGVYVSTFVREFDLA